MQIIGLVGGIASGKSLVAEQFRHLGAAVLDADQAGHEVLHEPEVIAALRQHWGEGILDAAGQINRSAVARIVFAPASAAEKQFLEQLTHPRIQMRIQQQIAQAQAAGKGAAILDAALLFEAGWDQVCDQVIFVDCPRETRQTRAASRGWSAEQFAAREAAQLPVETKREQADFVVDNSGPREATQQQVVALWNRLFPRSTIAAKEEAE